MLLFVLHNYLVFLPLCILVFFVISFYVKKHKHNKIPLDYLEEDYKGEIKDAYEKNKVFIEKPIKPKDFNDIQTMTKYNKNTYRDSKGRYASLK